MSGGSDDLGERPWKDTVILGALETEGGWVKPPPPADQPIVPPKPELDNQLPEAGVDTGARLEFHDGVGKALVAGIGVLTAGAPKVDEPKLLLPPNGSPKGLLSPGAAVLPNGEADAKGLGLLWNGFVKPPALPLLSPKPPVQLEAPSGLLSATPAAPPPPRILALWALTRRLHV